MEKHKERAELRRWPGDAMLAGQPREKSRAPGLFHKWRPFMESCVRAPVQ